MPQPSDAQRAGGSRLPRARAAPAGGGEEPLQSAPASRPPAAPASFSSQNPAPLGLSAARLSFLLSARRAARRVRGGSGAPLPPPPFPETPRPAAGGWDASLLCGVPGRLPARLCWRPGVRGAAARLPAFVPRAPWAAPPSAGARRAGQRRGCTGADPAETWGPAEPRLTPAGEAQG